MKVRCERRGFTLIELIVVIAILGVLIGISAPTIFSYLNAGDVVKCRANIEQLAKLGVKYGSDMGHRNLLPTSGMDDDEDTPGINESDGWWIMLAQELDSTVLPESKKGAMKVATIFHCPGDRRATVEDGMLMKATTKTVSYVSWSDGSEDPGNPHSQIRTVGKKHMDNLPWLSDGEPVKRKSVVDFASFRKMVKPVLERHSNAILVAYASGVVQQYEVDNDGGQNAKELFNKINPDKLIPMQSRGKKRAATAD